MDNDARLFEAGLRALEDGATLDTASATGDESGGDRAVAYEDLRLVAALKGFQLPQAEAEAARERVQARVMSAIATSSTQVSPAHTDERTRPNIKRARCPQGRDYLWRVVAVAAALLIAGAIGDWRISSAAASAYPGSSLYAIKTLEERLALATAWSDERKGTVLATIADHRLSELTFEGRRHDQPLVHSLSQQYSATMCSLILLAATMRRDHEDTSVVLEVLTQELHAEETALHDAQTVGNAMLTQVLAATVEGQRNTISAENLNVTPPALSQPKRQGLPPYKPSPASPPHSQGTSQPSHPNNGNGNQGDDNANKGSGNGARAHASATGGASRDSSGNTVVPAPPKTSQPPVRIVKGQSATDATHQVHGED